MKKHLAMMTGLLFCSLAAGVQESKAAPRNSTANNRAQIQQPQDGIRWVGSLQELNEEANETGKPILAYFFMKTCPACRMLNQNTLVDPGVALLAEEFVASRLDYEQNRGLLPMYGVRAYPTLVFASSKGTALGNNLVGFENPDRLSLTMALVLAKHSLPQLQEAVETAPDDLRAVAKLAIVYASSSSIEKSKALFSKVVEADPNNEQGYWLPIERALAEFFYSRREYKSAIPYLNYQVNNAEEPYEIAQAHYRLALSYIETQQPDKAAAPLQFVIQNRVAYVLADQKKWIVEQMAATQE